MHKSIITASTILVTLVFSTVASFAQDNNPIDIAKAFPPTLVDNHETALANIDWQLKQLKQSMEYYSGVCNSDRTELAKLVINSNVLFAKLPMELRFTNEKVREELVGACLQELLSAKLEIASNEEMISQLSEELEKSQHEQADINRLEKEKQQLKIRAIESKYAQARDEFDRIKKLHDNGSLSDRELASSKNTLEIAGYELAQARLEMEIEIASRSSEIAQRLVEARIKIQPIKARAAAAEKFLNLYADSSDILSTIDSENRRIESIKTTIDEYVRKLSAVSDQIADLESLKQLINSALKQTDSQHKADEKSED